MPRDKRKRKTSCTEGTAGPAKHNSWVQPNSVQRTEGLGVLSIAGGIFRAVFLAAIFPRGLLAIIAIPVKPAGLVDPGAPGG